uniref:ATP synthase subunit a n=1 Tax=Microthoracius praelongiceps TaxID=1958934 RepID=A0A1S5XVR3_9NEOP|nr:ATP synthase protein 6 [Microthoracius praelongiceps]
MTSSCMSMFDPSSSISIFPWKWVTTCLIFVMFLTPYWNGPSSFHLLYKYVTHKLITPLMNQFIEYKQHSLILMSLFWMILSLNILGLMPFVFSCTSHIMFNFSLSLPMWGAGLIYLLWKNKTQFYASFVIPGMPIGITLFLVIIEVVSSLIRPLSLSIRLMANMVAGHVIIELLEEGTEIAGLMLLGPATLIKSGLVAFELGVSAIQAYVFSSLISQYWEESEVN